MPVVIVSKLQLWKRCIGDLQLIQPKLTERRQAPPKTTSHAFSPPSGKELGSIGPGAVTSVVEFAFSRSLLSGWYSTYGRIFAPVCFSTSSSE